VPTRDDLRIAFDREAAHWHRRHGSGQLVRLVRRWRTRRLLRACRLGPTARVLDAGCGTGEQLIELLPWIGEGVGIDLSPAMIDYARALALASGADQRLRFGVGAIEDATPQELGLFDAALFIGSLEHMLDPGLALSRAASLLRPGGRIAVVAPHPWHPRALWHRLQAGCGQIPPFRLLTRRALMQVARPVGLKPVSLGLASALENLVSFCLLGSTLVVFEHAPTYSRSSDHSSLTLAKKPSDSG
jgi:SAM-dependent methyltransferase